MSTIYTRICSIAESAKLRYMRALEVGDLDVLGIGVSRSIESKDRKRLERLHDVEFRREYYSYHRDVWNIVERENGHVCKLYVGTYDGFMDNISVDVLSHVENIVR